MQITDDWNKKKWIKWCDSLTPSRLALVRIHSRVPDAGSCNYLLHKLKIYSSVLYDVQNWMALFRSFLQCVAAATPGLRLECTFSYFSYYFFATLALADAAAEEAALEAVDTLAQCYIFVCVVYTCVADFPKCVYKKGQDCTRQRSDYAENASLALLCMRAAHACSNIRLVLYFPSTLFSGFFKFCKHIDLQFPSFSPFSSLYLPESRVHVGPRRRSHSHWLFLWYLAPDKLHTWENLHHTLAQQIAF